MLLYGSLDSLFSCQLQGVKSKLRVTLDFDANELEDETQLTLSKVVNLTLIASQRMKLIV